MALVSLVFPAMATGRQEGVGSALAVIVILFCWLPWRGVTSIPIARGSGKRGGRLAAGGIHTSRRGLARVFLPRTQKAPDENAPPSRQAAGKLLAAIAASESIAWVARLLAGGGRGFDHEPQVVAEALLDRRNVHGLGTGDPGE